MNENQSANNLSFYPENLNWNEKKEPNKPTNQQNNLLNTLRNLLSSSKEVNFMSLFSHFLPNLDSEKGKILMQMINSNSPHKNVSSKQKISSDFYEEI